ncbi:MAG: hypothetical protein QNK11_05780 [Legionella sp.]|nr:hypothetical protein [Legionella sp.]
MPPESESESENEDAGMFMDDLAASERERQIKTYRDKVREVIFSTAPPPSDELLDNWMKFVAEMTKAKVYPGENWSVARLEEILNNNANDANRSRQLLACLKYETNRKALGKMRINAETLKKIIPELNLINESVEFKNDNSEAAKYLRVFIDGFKRLKVPTLKALYELYEAEQKR